ncbi:MAG: multidrug effflux MFS transporter [Clostridium sp.]|nr:multidrug effflux MFS transporter [Clostridium sp.]
MGNELNQDGPQPAVKVHVWYFVTLMVMLSMLGSFVNDMFTPALPAMCRFFHASIPTVQMGLTLGMAGLAVGQLLLGPISDRYGRKPVLLVALLLFIAAAIVSVHSPTIHFFIACRFFQGVGASAGYMLARTMPADLYGGRQLAKMMALIGAINGVAPASAPVLGGVTADAYGWKGIFVVLAILAGVIWVMTLFGKETLPPSKRAKGSIWQSFDGYKGLIGNGRFMLHVTFKGLALGLLFAYISATPFILQTHYGFSQTQYGLIIGGNALFVVCGATLAMRFKPLKKAATIGAALLLLGAAAQAFALWHVKSMALFEVCMGLMLFGLGLIFTTTNTLAMNEGRGHAGEASALLGIMGYIVGGVVSPLVGLGNVMHSTAIAFVVLAVLVFVCSIFSRRFAPEI